LSRTGRHNRSCGGHAGNETFEITPLFGRKVLGNGGVVSHAVSSLLKN
jgi:hypothetical protein